jgi:hypothetical protein
MSLVAAAMDVKHHGRYNRDLNQDTDQSIFLALIANDPWVEFTKIDIDWREKRSIRSVAEIKAMNAVFKNKTYDANKQDFV